MTERVIHILPEQVASQIAAGEVVERPASALKELMENSLDAGARAINVEIERGGCGLIDVADDGCGMGREDAILSLRRHATSKIRDASDLGAVRTLGFRGEALASISSVARLRLRTRRPDDPHGAEIAAEGGEIAGVRECALAPGTRIEVRDLFFNTPARLKFLKTVPTEQSACVEVVQRFALANCGIAFAMRSEGRALLELARASRPLERLRQLFGAKLADRMLGFERARDGMRARGLLSMSQESFPTPRMVFTYVNGRAVRDRLLLRAIAQAYETLLPRGRHPAVALFVELKPADVDVNVHPMKTEVRFRSPGVVFELVYFAMRERLADQTPGAQMESAGPAAEPEKRARADEAATTASGQPVGLKGGPAEPRPLRLVVDESRRAAEQRALGLGFAPGQAGPAPSLTGHSPSLASQVPTYSALKLVGQVFRGFIALEADGALVLVDQHAAHERVTFERLKTELKDGGVRVQALLAPETLELNPARAGQIAAGLPELRALGFDVEAFGPSTLLLKGVPAVFETAGALGLLSDMVESVGEVGVGARREAAFEDLLKRLACHGSIRVGRVLKEDEMRRLLSDLDHTEFKTNCPHGRPVHVQFPLGQIERMFRR